MLNNHFYGDLLLWWNCHGRKNLPWQKYGTAYHIWVAEIMLQQTQVNTVIDYYLKFLLRFPSVFVLAEATQDEVLHSWSGLGYYRRAINLWTTAKVIAAKGGNFPETVAELEKLPGIGRSTAGAIIAQSMGKKGVILDGNVKRVLCRYLGIFGEPNKSQTLKALWQAAEHFTPDDHVKNYNQAMMDLGATLCKRKFPECLSCPLNTQCFAYKTSTQHSLPIPKPKKTKPEIHYLMILLTYKQQVYLELRPPHGVWGGLYSLPEYKITDVFNLPPLIPILKNFVMDLGLPSHITDGQCAQVLVAKQHQFTHFRLHYLPVHVNLQHPIYLEACNTNQYLWYDINDPPSVGLSKVGQNLIETFRDMIHDGNEEK